ncbi:MAG: hypothetical protein F4Y02_03235 [Chloroflexi bacterium]|nr:hypothetical protein [Chloroflexota bacterium]
MEAQGRRDRQEDVSDGQRVRRYRREITRVPDRAQRCQSREDLQRFFAECDAREGPGVEPDWEVPKRAIEESRTRGLPDV